MRAIWSGSISFGLVNIPVKVYSASEVNVLSFDLLHKDDLSPVRYARVCKSEEKEIDFEDIIKGYEYDTGKYVPLDEDDFSKADAKKTKSIEIVGFTDQSEVDSVYFEKPYYLEPAKEADKPYILLKEALAKTKKVGIAKFVMRNREHLAMIRPYGDVIILNQMRFSEEIRDAGELRKPDAKVKTEEVDLAVELIKQLDHPFKPEEFKDTFTKEIKKIIEAKSRGEIPKQKGAPPKPTEAEDLMKKLKASLQKTKAG